MKQETIKKLLELVKNNYQEIASDFSITRNKALWPEVENIAKQVKQKKVLDVGCGNGRLLQALPENNEYLGVDSSEELIKIAKEKYQQNFVVDDILDLKNIANNYYDYIFCLAVLQHIPSQELRKKVLDNLIKKLKPGGEIIISNWNLWNTKHKKLIVKTAILKFLGQNDLDFGDIVFPWKNNKGESVSLRYYHAFNIKELKTISNNINVEVKKLYKDKYNYWLILKKK